MSSPDDGGRSLDGSGMSVPGGNIGGGSLLLLDGGAAFKLSLCWAFSLLAASVISALGSAEDIETNIHFN